MRIYIGFVWIFLYFHKHFMAPDVTTIIAHTHTDTPTHIDTRAHTNNKMPALVIIAIGKKICTIFKNNFFVKRRTFSEIFIYKKKKILVIKPGIER